VKVTVYSHFYEDGDPPGPVLCVEIDGEEMFEASNYNDMPKYGTHGEVLALLRAAYAAGIRGEEFELTETTDCPPSYLEDEDEEEDLSEDEEVELQKMVAKMEAKTKKWNDGRAARIRRKLETCIITIPHEEWQARAVEAK